MLRRYFCVYPSPTTFLLLDYRTVLLDVSKSNGFEIVLSFRLTNVPDEDYAGLGPSPIGSNATSPRLLIKYLDVCLAETEVNCDDGVKYKVRYNGDASLDQTPQLNQLNDYEIVITSTATVRENGFNHIDAVLHHQKHDRRCC